MSNIVELLQKTFAAARNESELEKIILLLLQEPSIYDAKKTCIFYEAFDIAYFYEKSRRTELRRIARDTIRFIEQIDFKNKIIAKMGGDLNGLELSKKDGTMFCVFSREVYAGEEHKFRATYFTDEGFYSHLSELDWISLLNEVVQNGYRTEATGSLDLLSKTETFIAHYQRSLSRYIAN